MNLTSSSDYFFSYGCYMNPEMIKKDLGDHPERIGVYRLDDYEFSYSRETLDKKRTGGNIIPKEGAAVYGVVWKLCSKDFVILDKEENAPITYTRNEIKAVSIKDSQDVKCVNVYVGTKEYFSEICRPRPLYVKRVTEGARQNQLPEEYIQKYLDWSGPWGEN